MYNNIKSNYIFKKIIKEYLSKKSYFLLVKHNKKIQNKLGLKLDDYKEYHIRIFNTTEIELIPISELKPDIKYYFIRIKENRGYYHIYFDDQRDEIKRSYITNLDKVKKINIKLDMELKSLAGLFYDCQVLKGIKFTKFNRENFTNMNEMFYQCLYLDKLDIQKLKTSNITSMNWMFTRCESLKELNLLNFDTSNVKEMMCVFSGCIKLEKINFNFNTSKVNNMRNMFFECKSLKEIDVSNFDTSNVKNFSEMFYRCISLDNLNLRNFTFKYTFKSYEYDRKYGNMFGCCNNKLKENIRNQIVNFSEINKNFKVFDSKY